MNRYSGGLAAFLLLLLGATLGAQTTVAQTSAAKASAAQTSAAQTTVSVLGLDDEPLAGAVVRFTCLDGTCRDSTVLRLADRRGRAASPWRARVAVSISHVGYERMDDTLEEGRDASYTLRSRMGRDVVVTAQYAPGSSDRSVYPVKVLDRQRIEAQAAQTLRELMSNELNVRLSEDPVLGSSMSLQGLSGQNVKILVDGVPVVGRVNGNIDLSQISLSDAERVEVIEGPLSVVYGTDALGGVINVITDRKAPRAFRLDADGYYESAGTYNASASLGWRIDGTWLTLSGGRNLFDGYSFVDTSRSFQWKPREQYSAGVELSHLFDRLRVRYAGQWFDEYILNRGEPRAPYRETAFDDTYRTLRLTNAVSVNGALGDHGYLDGVVSASLYRRRKNTFYKDLVTLTESPSLEPSDHDTTRLTHWMARGSYSRDDSSAFAWQVGADLNVENTSGGRISGSSREIGDYALFAGMQIRPTSWIVLQPAVRGSYNTRYAAPLVPSVNVKIAPAPELTLRASYARGFRAPSLRDLYFFFVDINHNIRGNEDLRAESSHAINLSADWYPSGEDRWLEISPAVYYNDISDLITLAQVDGSLYSYVNIGVYRTLGGSMTATMNAAPFSARLGVSYTGRYNELAESREVPTFAFEPDVQASLTYELPVIGGTLSAFYKFTGRLPSFSLDQNGQLREGYVDSYQLLDLLATRPLGKGWPTLTLGVKNLLNVRDVAVQSAASESAHVTNDVSTPIAWGRTLVAGLKLTLQP